MIDITVVSPHRDDAALSLGMLLGRLARLEIRVRIVNCFTVSAWAPYRAGLTTEGVTRMRHREDLRFGRQLVRRPLWRDLRGLDAPLRLGDSFPILDCPVDAMRASDVAWLQQNLDALIGSTLVLAPLALGHHIDHLVARHAAAALHPSRTVAFYEDIPYAGFVADDARAAAIAETESLVAQRLSPLTIRGTFAEKRSLAQLYASQIGTEELNEIRTATARLGGERLWMNPPARARLESWLERSAA